ncbi:MAG: hypothetical protein HQL56_00830 [Magnetococcales bacterium]|nr:hypothetical protein [Magnetococcales bacterium]
MLREVLPITFTGGSGKMQPRSGKYHQGRRILSAQQAETQQRRLDELAENVRYGGNPEHKKNPGDFGLTPPGNPRPGKTLCDVAGILTRQEATALLR